jgi:periplasmic protein TonB
MFENLVDSTNNKPRNHSGKYFLATAFLWSLILVMSIVTGIMYYDAQLTEQYQLLSMVALPPAPAPAAARPAVAQTRSVAKTVAAVSPIPTREVPDHIETPTAEKAVAVTDLSQLDKASGTGSGIGDIGADYDIGSTPGGTGTISGFNASNSSAKVPPPPPVEERVEKAPPVDPPMPTQIRRSEGVLRGNAINRPVPDYPPLARQANVSGDVIIEILVDEQGEVSNARVLQGHPLLRAAALQAAQQWKFRPTLLNNQPVKVQGVLTFRFTR